MADWSKPDLLSTEAEYTDEIKARDEDLAKQFDGTTSTNLPDGTIRWNSINKFWEKLVAGVWNALCDVYNIVVSRALNADNADTLNGLDSSQFLRSDADDTFTGTLTSTIGAGVPIKLDNGDVRITIHDGYGNFNLKLHATESETYEETGSGAAAIKLNASSVDGYILLLTAPIGTAGDSITWAGQFKVDGSGVYFNGNKVWHAGNDGPGSGLEADLLDGAHATATPTPGAIPIADSTGKLATGWIPDTIPTGTRMLFGSVPPAGWVLVTDFHDRVLRIVNDATLVGLTGGDWAITGLSASTTVDGHALTIDEIPPHAHTVNVPKGSSYNGGYPSRLTMSPYYYGELTLTTSSVGSGLAHSHGATTTVSQDGSWRPAYLNIVMAEKA